MFGLVADDVTGANATAARVAARTGIPGRVVLDPGTWTAPAATDDADPLAAAADAEPSLHVVPTHSRTVEPAEARRRVRTAFLGLRRRGCRRFGKRIDSTLRGNLGAELAGALDALPGHLAVVVAAFPASGRATVAGRLRIHGVPLLDTEAARDPVTPVTDDDVARLLVAQSGLDVRYLPPGPAGYGDDLPERLARLHGAGVRAVVLDATTDDDVETLAALVARAPVPVLAVDPGPFFAAWLAHQPEVGAAGAGTRTPPALAAATSPPPLRERGPWLVVAGSLTTLTDRQLAALCRRWPVARLRAPLDQLLADPEGCAATLLPAVNAALERWGLAVVETDRRQVLGGTQTGGSVSGGAAQRVAHALGRMAAQLTERLPPLAGLVLTGGDTAAAVATALGAGGLHITSELAPLVAGGSLEGGRRSGLAVITKGGLVGDDHLLIRLLEHRVGRADPATAPSHAGEGADRSDPRAGAGSSDPGAGPVPGRLTTEVQGR
ncbi:four-carbon acid sugar kinase family protein [Thermaerobacter sp. FW80]|uniref:four-carbon acid sugar kinase family protein n=1 Tax=Thermaerobacter sp. FW80 TaxID=2546351 RepID=UPI001074AA9E|nr:four-carbon acid sugar kinase family protein [Thermaerobacter sp. FW80]QBS36768.1 four-carbon acid sugar kinase family protein [Thermaerobacter sp. FW80]